MEDWTPEAVRKNVAIFLFVVRGITDTKQRFYNLSLNRGKYCEISCYQSAQRRTNSGPSTARILENSVVFLARGGSITLEVTGDTVNNFVGEWKFHAV